MPNPPWFCAAQAKLGAEILSLTPVSGGDINDAFRLELSDGRLLFAKRNARPKPRLFESEAWGLEFLAGATTTLILPEVVFVSAECLILEYLRPTTDDQSERLGRGLAELHAADPSARPGAPFDGYIGTLPQDNGAVPHRSRPSPGGDEAWIDFYREKRLLAQMDLPGAQRHLPAALRENLHKLIAALDSYIPKALPMSRLHGDLWSGNFMFTDRGPAIFDPAPYFGHREVDLAMMQLFGGFSERVFQSYEELLPAQAGASERIGIYQLYPLLVHVNLFGAGYVGSVARIVDRLT